MTRPRHGGGGKDEKNTLGCPSLLRHPGPRRDRPVHAARLDGAVMTLLRRRAWLLLRVELLYWVLVIAGEEWLNYPWWLVLPVAVVMSVAYGNWRIAREFPPALPFDVDGAS